MERDDALDLAVKVAELNAAMKELQDSVPHYGHGKVYLVVERLDIKDKQYDVKIKLSYTLSRRLYQDVLNLLCDYRTEAYAEFKRFLK